VSLQLRAIPLSPVSIVEAITRKDSESLAVFCRKYERGLRFLIRRSCLENSDECFAAVVNASIGAVLNGEILCDTELPRLIQAQFRSVLLSAERASMTHHRAAPDSTMPGAAFMARDLARRLKRFEPKEREALSRFYAQEESATSICRGLGLTPEQFNSIRKAGAQAARLTMNSRGTPAALAV
jgi:hypothetical protein